MSPFLWIGFVAGILVCVALDLGVFQRRAHAARPREALTWTALWVALAASFAFVVHRVYEAGGVPPGVASHDPTTGVEAVQLYFTAYLVEYSLSLDNVVVIALIFSHFRVPLAFQHRVLFWGVLGAIVLRFVFIFIGATLLAQVGWVSYLFGAILILSAGRILFGRDEGLAPERNLWVRLAERVYPVHDVFAGSRFFVRLEGRVHVTRLFVVLLLVESSDLVFAVDSIPAALAVTRDPFLVFTSNVFAVLGLRSLYFALAPLIARFRYLRASLVILLAFVGAKLALSHHVEIPTTTTLAVIVTTVAVGGLASLLRPGNAVQPDQDRA